METNNSVSVTFAADGGITIVMSMKREKYNRVVTDHRDLLLSLIAVLAEVESDDDDEPPSKPGPAYTA